MPVSPAEEPIRVILRRQRVAKTWRGPRIIYFIRYGTNGPIKIGIARDLMKRLDTLQSGAPEILRILHFVEGFITDERRLHERFAHLHCRGEWFEPATELLDYIESLRSAPARSLQDVVAPAAMMAEENAEPVFRAMITA